MNTFESPVVSGVKHPVPRADAAGYKKLAWALIDDALAAYHAYHQPVVREHAVATLDARLRELGMAARHRRKRIVALRQKLAHNAGDAALWFRGEGSAAYPFWLAAAWLGWEAEILSARLMNNRTGYALLVQRATTPKNAHESAEERVRQLLERHDAAGG